MYMSLLQSKPKLGHALKKALSHDEQLLLSLHTVFIVCLFADQ